MMTSDLEDVSCRSEAVVKGLVSVIIPTFNRARCIERAVRSVLEQTYTKLEILVVDDGSTDDTAEVIKSLDDSRVRWLPRQHAGACAARNFGMLQACGEYVAFHDSDDVWLPEKVARQLELLDATGADVCFCRMKSRIVGRRKEWYVPPLAFGREDVCIEEMLSQNFVSTQTLLGRREAMLSEMFDESFPRLQDWDYSIRLMRNNDFVFAEDVLVEQRVGLDSISANPSWRASALELLMVKHRDLYDAFPSSEARALRSLGKTYLALDATRARRAFMESWSINHGAAALAGLMASPFVPVFSRTRAMLKRKWGDR